MLGRDHPAATHATCPQTFLSFFLFPRPPTHRETSPRDPFYLHWRHYKDLESLRAGNYVCSQPPTCYISILSRFALNMSSLSSTIDPATTAGTTESSPSKAASSKKGGLGLAIALPTIFGIVLISIITILILGRLRKRRQSERGEGSLEAREEQVQDRPPSFEAEVVPKNDEKIVDSKTGGHEGTPSENQKSPEKHRRERSNSIPVSPTTNDRQSHRHSRRRGSEVVLDQFEDPPKPHRKGKRPSGVTQEKMPPP